MVDIALETKYADVHKSLIALIDDITIKHVSNSIEDINTRFDNLISQLDPIIFAHMNKPRTKHDIIRLNQFLRQLLDIKNLVYDQTLITLPILKSIHQSVNITDFEKTLTPKIDMKDGLNVDYIKLNKEYQENLDKFLNLKLKLSTLITETQINLEKLPRSDKQNRHQLLKDTNRRQLKEIKKLKQRSSILSEFLLSLVASLNVNWSNDDTLKRIVLYCGTVDENEELQNLLDQISSDDDDDDEEDEEDEEDEVEEDKD